MKAGIERRYPLPLTVVVSVQKIGSNRALTFRKALIVTVHVVAAPLPLQSSPQPMKTEPGLGCAVSVTTVSLGKFQAQALPQSMPGGFDVTTPEPMPNFTTFSENTMSNVAVTLVAALIVTVHVLACPEQAPLQPLNTAPALACAVNATTVPLVYGAAQVLPQSIPGGLDVTTPVPAPLFNTARMDVASNRAVTLVAALIVTAHVVA